MKQMLQVPQHLSCGQGTAKHIDPTVQCFNQMAMQRCSTHVLPAGKWAKLGGSVPHLQCARYMLLPSLNLTSLAGPELVRNLSRITYLLCGWMEGDMTRSVPSVERWAQWRGGGEAFRHPAQAHQAPTQKNTQPTRARRSSRGRTTGVPLNRLLAAAPLLAGLPSGGPFPCRPILARCAPLDKHPYSDWMTLCELISCPVECLSPVYEHAEKRHCALLRWLNMFLRGFTKCVFRVLSRVLTLRAEMGNVKCEGPPERSTETWRGHCWVGTALKVLDAGHPPPHLPLGSLPRQDLAPPSVLRDLSTTRAGKFISN